MLEALVKLLANVTQYFTRESKLYRLRRKERKLQEEIRRAYKKLNNRRIADLYRELRWVRAEIRELEKLN